VRKVCKKDSIGMDGLKGMQKIKREMTVIQEIKTIVTKNTADIAQIQQPVPSKSNVQTTRSMAILLQMQQSAKNSGQIYKKLHDLPEKTRTNHKSFNKG